MSISHTIKSTIKTWIRSFLYLCPVQNNKVVFVNYKGNGYGDNPKYTGGFLTSLILLIFSGGGIVLY